MLTALRGAWGQLVGRQVQRLELTIENSGLNRLQIEEGLRALQVLGLGELELITQAECNVFLYAVGLSPTDDVMASKLYNLQLQDSPSLSFPQLCHLWSSILQDLTDEDDILQKAFCFFDKDGNGEISIAELRTTMHELGDLLTEDEINAFMQVMDVDMDGVTSYHEFLHTLRTRRSDQQQELDREDDACSDEGCTAEVDDAVARQGLHMATGATMKLSAGAQCASAMQQSGPRHADGQLAAGIRAQPQLQH